MRRLANRSPYRLLLLLISRLSHDCDAETRFLLPVVLSGRKSRNQNYVRNDHGELSADRNKTPALAQMSAHGAALAMRSAPG